jgi:putative PIN family toxin of toxin-antitoxin system
VKAVVDTNVFISGLFFSGTPRRLYLAWTQGAFTGVLTPEILAEYRRVAVAFLSRGYDVQIEEALDLVVQHSVFIEAAPLPSGLCRDPNDDMFVACALAADADCVISGDKDLLALRGQVPFAILKPAEFMAENRTAT